MVFGFVFYLVFGNLWVYTVLAGSPDCKRIEATAHNLWGTL